MNPYRTRQDHVRTCGDECVFWCPACETNIKVPIWDRFRMPEGSIRLPVPVDGNSLPGSSMTHVTIACAMLLAMSIAFVVLR